MLSAQTTVALGLLVACIVVAIWDIYCLALERPEYTVSNLFGQWGSQFPIFPFLLGLLAGHLFWPRGQWPLQIPKP